MLNLKIQQLVTSERLKSIDALLQHTLDKRENLFEDIRVRKDGTQFPIEVHSRVIEFQGQAAILSVSRDITERKQAETQLKFRAQLLDSAMDAIYVLNERGNIVYFNESAHRSRGYTREEMATKRLRDLIAPDFFTSLSAQLNKLMDEKGETTIETTALCKDKSTFPVEIHSRLIKLGDEEFIVNISRNISQRKQAEDDLKKSYEQLEKTYNGVTKVISAAIEIRDPYTAGHQVRVARLAQALAWEMNLAEEQANQIYTAGLIHDIGKINIPAEILSKAGKLNDIEFSLIKMHSQSGYDVLKNIEFPYPMAQWVLEHHERMNGSGYPYGLTGDKIGLEARIIAVADVVEAMSSHRPYRAALGIDAALAEIKKNKGILYDSAAVEACLRLFNEKGFKLE